MTLLEKIGQLRLQALAAGDENRVRSRSGEFAALHERLEALTIDAKRNAAARLELESAGYKQDDHSQDRVLALDTVKELIETIRNLPVDAKFDGARIQGSNIEKYFRSSAKYLTSTWSAHLPNTIPNDDDLLDALERGGVDVEEIRSKIESAKSVLVSLQNRTLPGPGDMHKLQKALSTLDSSGTLIGEVINPEIASLVVRAQDGGVPYSELTPEVTSALAEIGILERFRVVLK